MIFSSLFFLPPFGRCSITFFADDGTEDDEDEHTEGRESKK